MKRLLSSAVLLCAVFFFSVQACANPAETMVKYGMRGPDVQTVQKLLLDAGYYHDSLDGVFGNLTLQAVKKFQQSQGLMVDGMVGKETFRYLERIGSVAPSRFSRELVMKASAYTRFDDGNGSYTCRGNFLRKGLVAVDPMVIPLGTRLYIPGYGYALADDTGGAIRGNRIDLAFESQAEAFQFGVQRITVYILE